MCKPAYRALLLLFCLQGVKCAKTRVEPPVPGLANAQALKVQVPNVFNGLVLRVGPYEASGAGVRESGRMGGEVLGFGGSQHTERSQFKMKDEASEMWTVTCGASWDDITLFSVQVPLTDTGHRRFGCSFVREGKVRGQLAFATSMGLRMQLDEQTLTGEPTPENARCIGGVEAVDFKLAGARVGAVALEAPEGVWIVREASASVHRIVAFASAALLNWSTHELLPICN
jgi:hypothetical protein